MPTPQESIVGWASCPPLQPHFIFNLVHCTYLFGEINYYFKYRLYLEKLANIFE